MINKKILIISKTIALFYLITFLCTVVFFVINNQSNNHWLVLFISYWLLPFPFIFFSLLYDTRRRKETIFGFLAAVLLLPILGSFFYTFVGIIPYTKKDQKAFTNKIHQMLKTNEVSDLKVLKGSTKSSYSVCKCYLDASEWMNSILDEVLNAKHEICISFFYILQGRNKNALLKALILKIQEGVKVYIAIDASSKLFGAKNRDLLMLKKFGATIDVIKHFYGLPFSFYSNLRSHYKIVIIDGYKCFTGGANIGDLYIHQKRKMGYWNDNYFFIAGSSVAQTLKSIIAINGKQIKKFDYVAPINSSVDNHTLEIIENQPEFSFIKHEDAIKKLMSICKKRFYIYIPYLVSPNWLLNGLIKLAKKGIDVKIIIPHYADKKSVYLITKYNAQYLNKKGVKVLLLKHSYVHSKTLICDNTVFSGTSNFDNRSFYLNYEIMFYITNLESIVRFVQKWYYDELACVQWNTKKHGLTSFEKVLLLPMMLVRTVL